MDEGRLPDGYSAPIHQALWERITTAGVPRLWFILSIVVCVFFIFALFTKYRSWVALIPGLAWGVMYVILLALTRWDERFDEVLFWSFRYRSKYDAG